MLAFGAVADGMHDDAPALCAAVSAAAIGTVNVVNIARPITLRSDVDRTSCKFTGAVPATSFVVPRGGGIRFAKPGLSMELRGDLVAGPYQVFFGESPRWGDTTLFTSGAVLPEWWGAQGDGITDDTRAIAKAISASRGEVVLRPVTYLVRGSAGEDLFGLQAKRIRGQRYGATGGTVISVSLDSGHLRSIFRALTSRIEIHDLKIESNQRSEHGVLLDGAHGSVMSNVTVSGSTSHGFNMQRSMNAIWTQLVAISNGGDGIRLSDSNASRLIGAYTTLNRGVGISVRSTSPESGAASAGVTIVAPDVEDDAGGGIEFVGTTSVSTLINPWIEAKFSGDALRIDRAKHVTVLGGRFSGLGTGNNRAVRITSGSSGIGLFGVRLKAGDGNRSYESIEVEAGATAITALDARVMVQGVGSVASLVPVSGLGASQVWTGSALRQTNSKAANLDALREDFNTLLGRLRAAGLLQPEPEVVK